MSSIAALAQSLNETCPQLGINVAHLQQAAAIYGGDTHQAWRLDTQQGAYFLKTCPVHQAPLLQAEAFALEKLHAHSQELIIPNVLAHGHCENQAWLLMEYIPLSAKGDDMALGRGLARLHRHSADYFGWPQDNFIGHNQQLNTRHTQWVDFYRHQRLKPQLQWAKDRQAPTELIDSGEKLLQNLEQFFQHYQPIASLLHGDLWSGNYGFNSQGQGVIFDPASYYGDRETDLAMTYLFGGFSAQFYQGYQQEWPLDPGFKQRKALYNLYHLLNHYNLFGGHYAQQSLALIQQLNQTARTL